MGMCREIQIGGQEMLVVMALSWACGAAQSSPLRECRWLPADFPLRCRCLTVHLSYPESPYRYHPLPYSSCPEALSLWSSGVGIFEARFQGNNGFDSFVAKFVKMFWNECRWNSWGERWFKLAQKRRLALYGFEFLQQRIIVVLMWMLSKSFI